MIPDTDVRCKLCNRAPDQISDCKYMASVENISTVQWVKENEGTYNKKTGKFYCTTCYIKIGMPLGKA